MCPLSAHSENRTICYCFGIDLLEIQAAFNEGAQKIQEIQNLTLASTGCGGCEVEILNLLTLWKENRRVFNS